MHLTSISVSLLAASSLAAAHPTQHTDDRLQSHSRSRHVPIHHIPAEYLSLFDPAKHEYLTAKLKAHQEAIRVSHHCPSVHTSTHTHSLSLYLALVTNKWPPYIDG
jgi:hypothetical protein